MTPDQQHFGTVVDLNNSSVAPRRSEPAIPHTAGRQCYRNNHCILVHWKCSFLESCSADPCKGPGSDFGIGMETRLLGKRKRKMPGYSVHC